MMMAVITVKDVTVNILIEYTIINSVVLIGKSVNDN
jgi:hypothetical protein